MKTTIWCFAFALVFGLMLLSQPATAVAQNQPKPDREKKQKVEKDDDDEDEDDDEVGPEERKLVRVSLEAAREIALREVNGKIIDEELEKEHGRIQYAFDIKKSDGRVFDVEIDAITGEVLQAIEDDEDDDDDDCDKPSEKHEVKKPVERAAKTAKIKPQ